jgi:D-alanine-D-alanine ligase
MGRITRDYEVLTAMDRPTSESSSLLNWLDASKVTILYLAKHAPIPGDTKPSLHPVYGVTPIYHYEIFTILRELGFQVESERSLSRLLEGPRTFDYVFSLYNKAPFHGSEVFVSAICEYLGIPYLGARPHVRALAEDKHLTKLLAKHLGISVPVWNIYRRETPELEEPSFVGPYIAKPRCGAGSMGITDDSVQEQWPGLKPLVQEILERGDDALVERFIEGDNVTVGLLGGDEPLMLPPIQGISHKRGGILTFRQKKMLDTAIHRLEFPESEHRREIETLSARIFRELQPVDYARIDYRVPISRKAPPYLLEVNICCNLGSHSSLAQGARQVGISQLEMVARILDYSFRRQKVGG